MSSAALASSSSGTDIRTYDVTLLAGDTGPAAFSHGLPFTPTYWDIVAVSGLGTDYPQIAVAVTASTVTVSKKNAANTQGVYKLYVGRFPQPQNLR